MSYSLGIDVGGTFTDFVVLDEQDRVTVLKQPTTLPDPSLGVLDGGARLAGGHDLQLADATRIVHGTTLVANSLIQRSGARTALITTRGFGDLLELGREARYDLYDLNLERPEPLIPRFLRFEIDERIMADGRVLQPIDAGQARALAELLLRLEVESVAIALINSYANPAHEKLLAQILARVAPGLDLTLSWEVAPEWGEFERTSTAAANAFVRPLVRRYLAGLEDGFARAAAGGRLQVLTSHGGVISAEMAAELPIQLVESGPAGGVMAAAYFGRRAGLDDLVSFDMGGTTSKVSVIEGGVPLQVSELEVARVSRLKRGSGIPLKVWTIELVEVGMGGGSIASENALGLLDVGPLSAGADPGPACYGQGGGQPTVTDADLSLGLLDAGHFLGGAMVLHPERARVALEDLGRRLRLDLEDCAGSIYEVVNRQMGLALRSHIVERGHDPRRFTMVAFGGAGPVHAYEVARHLGMARILYPPVAGVASALGFLLSPFAVNLVRTQPGRLESLDWRAVSERFREMGEQALALLERAGKRLDDVIFERRVDMRYAGQGYEVPVPVPAGPLNAGTAGPLRTAFVEVYRRRFGSHLLSSEPEALHWRLSARLAEPPRNLVFPPAAARDARKGVRRAYFPELCGFAECPVYDRYLLAPGTRLSGPLLIEERESTIVLGPSAEAEVDSLGNVMASLPGRPAG